jgi:hypothetical protein
MNFICLVHVFFICGEGYIVGGQNQQAALVQYAELMADEYPELELMFSVPGGVVAAAKLHGGSVGAGFPDVFLPVARGAYHGLAICVSEGSGLALHRQWWAKKLREQGYFVFVCGEATEAVVMSEVHLAVAEYMRGAKWEHQDLLNWIAHKNSQGGAENAAK